MTRELAPLLEVWTRFYYSIELPPRHAREREKAKEEHALMTRLAYPRLSMFTGEISRDNVIAFLWANGKVWSEMSPPYLCLNTNVEQHAVYRPIIHELVRANNRWTEEDIVESASTFLDGIIKSTKPLRIKDDILLWVAIYLHKVSYQIYFKYAHTGSDSASRTYRVGP